MDEDNNVVDYDFDGTAETFDFPTVPAGTYLCRVEEARPGTTRSGHTRWALKYVVHEGAETGRIAAWDGLTFSPKAAGRTRQVLAALGLPHDGKVRLHARDLIGRLAFVTVEEGVWRNPTTGVTAKRNSIPYDGVRPAEGERTPGPEVGGGAEQASEVPF